MLEEIFRPVDKALSLRKSTYDGLKRLGIYNIRDLLFFAPYNFKKIELHPNLSSPLENHEIIATVKVLDIIKPSRKSMPVKIMTHNSTGNLVLVFFNKFPNFLNSKFLANQSIIVQGKVTINDGLSHIVHPEFIFNRENLANVQPIYHLTYGINNKQITTYINVAIDILEEQIRIHDLSLKERKESSNLMENEGKYLSFLLKNIKAIHQYKQIGNDSLQFVYESYKKARTNLVKLELFANQISLQNMKKNRVEKLGYSFNIAKNEQAQILKILSFEATDAQKNVLYEIERDMQSDMQMMRLLQGDVGSGKTLVAFLSMLNATISGYQACLMAPTDLLAYQHYCFIENALKEAGLEMRAELLVGKTSLKQKRILKQDLADGKIDILIGTHALFQDDVNFNKLGYIVIDEQHRFGVEQRLQLASKANNPDILVMSATPIPRSLSLTMFGDMDISKILSKPKNRLPIITITKPNSAIENVIEALKYKLENNERIYWVCPLVDASDANDTNDARDTNDASSDIADDHMHSIEKHGKHTHSLSQNDALTPADATGRFNILSQIFGEEITGLVHGKMKANEKDAAMQDFKDGKYKILVSTTVIEVGIDVPEATMIVIENAERFGLAQLHQLRGRVGRGTRQSHCILVFEPKRMSAMTKERLQILRESNDGFYIAQEDLKLRGGGEIMGKKQSGEPRFFFAYLGTDLDILENANNSASEFTLNSFFEFQIKLFKTTDTLKYTAFNPV